MCEQINKSIPQIGYAVVANDWREFYKKAFKISTLL